MTSGRNWPGLPVRSGTTKPTLAAGPDRTTAPAGRRRLASTETGYPSAEVDSRRAAFEAFAAVAARCSMVCAACTEGMPTAGNRSAGAPILVGPPFGRAAQDDHAQEDVPHDSHADFRCPRATVSKALGCDATPVPWRRTNRRGAVAPNRCVWVADAEDGTGTGCLAAARSRGVGCRGGLRAPRIDGNEFVIYGR